MVNDWSLSDIDTVSFASPQVYESASKSGCCPRLVWSTSHLMLPSKVESGSSFNIRIG